MLAKGGQESRLEVPERREGRVRRLVLLDRLVPAPVFISPEDVGNQKKRDSHLAHDPNRYGPHPQHLERLVLAQHAVAHLADDALHLELGALHPHVR